MRNQLVAIELSTFDRHAPIVESTAAHAERPLSWADEVATQRFATRLATAQAIGDAFITLQGNLGAGKTTLVRHLLQALGVQGRIKSPTYAVVEAYTLPHLNAWHFDFYRFSDPREWEDAGFRDIFAGAGLKLVEWPDKAATVLPLQDLDITISSDLEGARHVLVKAYTGRGNSLLTACVGDEDMA
ncbi:tRNA (adenosine(37)-N6)-threonylcarbamoyltransferase complex ATPase subunit type 1 TsaE [Rhodoferax aquaticus]|uniref:tRNA threonylcarbamoyladenosine biosynthesis protein TsaE n=1 Tax=Rhodoferax aquaticus TaxID=2527691 RepID=A0A515EML4_9BURK|nr:tRNA (adenosine(37)-N6)-threonylcarbamoyltransferase complex ATPase subunit type 1 TsaE [Rhodoferax aquaticus]QDL53893.1 tRNA (adenosine(37)-N6)-threonylcarbamoyltransferase complex ATPase subunit type 1 TsaE [Rhodoferax aquaticus]